MTNTNKLLVGIIGVLLLLGVSPAWDDMGYYDGTVAINVHRASEEQSIRLDRIAFQLSRIADALEWQNVTKYDAHVNWYKSHSTNRQFNTGK